MRIDSRKRILVVDDEPQILGFLGDLLGMAGWEVQSAGSGSEGVEKLERDRFDVVLTDLKMPGADGIELLRTSKKIQPDAEVVLMTGFGTVDSAIEAMRAGAFHYLTKPFQGEEVLNLVGKAYDRKLLRQENLFLKAESRGGHLLGAVVGTSPRIQKVISAVHRLADADIPVLFAGGRGSGRAFFARILHFHSSRSQRLFVPIHCAGVGEEALLSDIFGHAAGAFGKAVLPHPGKISIAQHGSLFLSGIDAAGPMVQERILDLLRTRTFTPVGGGVLEADVRLLASTSEDLGELVANGTFSAALREALDPGKIVLPPLRDRTEDIPLLLHHFLYGANRERKKPLRGFSQTALDALSAYPWPGNVQELQEFVAAISSRKKQGTVVDAADIPPEILYGRKSRKGRVRKGSPPASADIGQSIEELERPMILQALALAEGNREKAAALLHIDLPAFEDLLRRMRITE